MVYLNFDEIYLSSLSSQKIGTQIMFIFGLQDVQ
jgi:hypothetical protein